MNCVCKQERISELLKIERGVTALIGGGGKTTLMLTLAAELAELGRVIVCTTTRIMPPEHLPLLCPDTEDAIEAAFNCGERVLCAAGEIDNGKLCIPCVSMHRLAQLADYVLVEADGAKRLPLKAHASHEPVIPGNAIQTIMVMGMDGIGKRIVDTCHRPEIYAGMVHVEPETIVTPELAMQVVRMEAMGDRIYINKTESTQDWENAIDMAAATELPVIAGSLHKGVYRCLR